MAKIEKMKKLFFILLVAGFAVSCGNDTTKSEEGTKSAPITPGIDNVNGNIPDTTESIRLNKTLPTDSVTGTDSTRR